MRCNSPTRCQTSHGCGSACTSTLYRSKERLAYSAACKRCAVSARQAQPGQHCVYPIPVMEHLAACLVRPETLVRPEPCCALVLGCSYIYL